MDEGNELARRDTIPQGGMGVKATEVQAEVQAAAVLAMNQKRDELVSWDRIVKSCQRPAFADGAEYSFTRGDSAVKGPSVKLARELARCWGNIRYGIRVLSMDAEAVQIEGWAWDLETNSRVSSEARFARKVQRKRGGDTVWIEADERNLRELINKHGAIAVRNAILQLLPPDMVEKAVNVCRRTLSSAADEKLKTDRKGTLSKVLNAWAAFDVTEKMLSEHMGKPFQQATGEDIAKLRATYQSVRDGNTDVGEHFDVGSHRAEEAQGELEGWPDGDGEEA